MTETGIQEDEMESFSLWSRLSDRNTTILQTGAKIVTGRRNPGPDQVPRRAEGASFAIVPALPAKHNREQGRDASARNTLSCSIRPKVLFADIARRPAAAGWGASGPAPGHPHPLPRRRLPRAPHELPGELDDGKQFIDFRASRKKPARGFGLGQRLKGRLCRRGRGGGFAFASPGQ